VLCSLKCILHDLNSSEGVWFFHPASPLDLFTANASTSTRLRNIYDICLLCLGSLPESSPFNLEHLVSYITPTTDYSKQTSSWRACFDDFAQPNLVCCFFFVCFFCTCYSPFRFITYGWLFPPCLSLVFVFHFPFLVRASHHTVP